MSGERATAGIQRERMPVTQKLGCVVEQIVDHGERVYTLALRPERPVPRFRAGQFLHLALDPYDPTGFWPESRVFSIASPPAERDGVRITYAVHGRFTARMESDLRRGPASLDQDAVRRLRHRQPGGRRPLCRRHRHHGVHGVSRGPDAARRTARSTLAYGARTDRLLIYRDVVERCAQRVPSLDVDLFRRGGAATATPPAVRARAGSRSTPSGRDCARPLATDLLHLGAAADAADGIGEDLRARNISAEAIHIDAWE